MDHHDEAYDWAARKRCEVNPKTGAVQIFDVQTVKEEISVPTEKFERKRFVYYSKDLNILSFHPVLWEQMSQETKDNISEKEREFLKAYYEKLGGL